MPKRRDIWLRLYVKTLHSRKIQSLQAPLFKWLVNFWLEARKHDGIIPPPAEIAWDLHCTEAVVIDAIDKLRKLELIDEVEGCLIPHDWDEHQCESDVSTERVKRLRERKRAVSTTVTSNVSTDVTETVDVTSQNRVEQSRVEQNNPITPSPDGSGAKQPKPERDPLTAEQRPWFAECYQRYPRKKNPRAARVAFGRRVKTPEAWERCKVALAEHCREMAGREQQHIPYPASWINAQDFERELLSFDEPEKPEICSKCGDSLTLCACNYSPYGH